MLYALLTTDHILTNIHKGFVSLSRCTACRKGMPANTKKEDKQSYQIELSALNMDMVAYPQYMS
jgi:hypothetical protein